MARVRVHRARKTARKSEPVFGSRPRVTSYTATTPFPSIDRAPSEIMYCPLLHHRSIRVRRQIYDVTSSSRSKPAAESYGKNDLCVTVDCLKVNAYRKILKKFENLFFVYDYHIRRHSTELYEIKEQTERLYSYLDCSHV